MPRIVNPTAAQVENAIMNHDAFMESFEIKVYEKGGIVTLRGLVPSKRYRNLAESIAEGIEGVSSINNQLQVDPSLAEEPDLLDLDDQTKVPPGRSGPHARH